MLQMWHRCETGVHAHLLHIKKVMCYRCGTGVEQVCRPGVQAYLYYCTTGVTKENILAMNVWHKINKDHVLSDITFGLCFFSVRKYTCGTPVAQMCTYTRCTSVAQVCLSLKYDQQFVLQQGQTIRLSKRRVICPSKRTSHLSLKKDQPFAPQEGLTICPSKRTSHLSLKRISYLI